MAAPPLAPIGGRHALAPIDGVDYANQQAPGMGSRMGTRGAQGMEPRPNPSANGMRDGLLRKSGSGQLPPKMELVAVPMNTGVISNVRNACPSG
jgi:hypothetical protein